MDEDRAGFDSFVRSVVGRARSDAPSPGDPPARRAPGPRGRTRYAVALIAAAAVITVVVVAVVASSGEPRRQLASIGSEATTEPSDQTPVTPAVTASPTTVAAERSAKAFCAALSAMASDMPEQYIGSAAQIADLDHLIELAPTDVVENLVVVRDYVASGAVTAADPESNVIANWPVAVRAATTALDLYRVSTCAQDGTIATDGSSTTNAGATLYETLTTVLESPAHGPELCIGGVLMSMPPQCGLIPIANWDWADIDGEESVNGTTWIEAVVTGAYDGTAFTVTEVHPASTVDTTRFTPEFTPPSAPCPEPAGGWPAQAANAASDASLDAVSSPVARYANAQPDLSTWFVDQSINPSMDTDPNDPRRLILVVLFTGDVARHEADLRAIWPGALCVAAVEHTKAELDDLANRVTAGVTGDGQLALPGGTVLRVLGTPGTTDPIDGTVTLDVVVADPAAQSYFDATYGPGRIIMHGELRPVGGAAVG